MHEDQISTKTNGQRKRFKAVVAVGDGKEYLGVGSKVVKEVQIAMKGAVMTAKLNLIPVRLVHHILFQRRSLVNVVQLD